MSKIVYSIKHTFKNKRIILQPCNSHVIILVVEQNSFVFFRQLVFYCNPFHGLGFFSVKDVAKQHPVHPPWANGFGVVGG